MTQMGYAAARDLWPDRAGQPQRKWKCRKRDRDMKKLLVLTAIFFALVASTAAVMTIHSQQAVACSGPNC
jgi:hypothetical protein